MDVMYISYNRDLVARNGIYIKQFKQIKQSEEHSYYIQLFGEDQHVGPINQKNIQDFEEKQEEFSKKAKPKLKDAISKAKKVLEERQSQKKRRLSESEDQIQKKKNIQTPRQTRIIKKKPDSEPNQGIEYQFQDLLPLLVATQPNYDQIKQKLSPILDYMDGQFKSNLNINDILSDRKGSILNAVFMILKHQSEQNPDHFFQRDISISIDKMHDILCKLRQNLMEKCFETSYDSPIQQVVIEKKEEKIESPKIIEEPIKIQKQIKSPKRTHIHKQPKMIKNTDNLNSFTKRSNQIPDPHLRRKVCNVMAKYVQLYGIDEDSSHNIVLKLEGLAREQDSSMKCKYGQLMWWTLLNLQNFFQQKSLKKEELLKLLHDEPQEVWETLTQQVPRDAKLQNILIN